MTMTYKQAVALNKVVENGGNVSKAMRDSGYSSSTAKNPKKLTGSKSWQEQLSQYLDDEELLSCLLEDIRSNAGNRKALLELAFKLKGRLHNNVKIDNEKPIPLLDINELIERAREKYDL